MAGGEKAAAIEYRKLRTMEEFREALPVQKEVWGFDDVETVPARLFLVCTRIGGHVIAAFDHSRMIGYCYSIPGFKGESCEPYLHSHMLGVLPEYRNRGIGRRLKLEQRNDALSRGIRLIEWTFDPLELKNAYLNIEKLGGIIRSLIRNNYGVTTSKLHTGLPTDRCVAEWRLDDPRTEAILAGKPRQREPVEERITIPNAISEIRRSDIHNALAIQQEASLQFEQYFARGLVVTGVERSADSGTYTFSQCP